MTALIQTYTSAIRFAHEETLIPIEDSPKNSLREIEQAVFTSKGILNIGKYTLGIVSMAFLSTGLAATTIPAILFSITCVISGVALAVLCHDINQIQSGFEHCFQAVRFIDRSLSISRGELLQIVDQQSEKLHQIKNSLIFLTPLRETISAAENSLAQLHNQLERA
ncbi:MAG: hypothetical protein KAR79_04450 [Simkaniaceae bacterium]|nr:hypothetical protein [Simkaniaceae bacterium]